MSAGAVSKEGKAAPGWLERLALHRPELRAWALYDWANSAMVTVIVTAVFPIYYAQVAAAELDPKLADARYAATTALALALIALLSPILGSLADRARAKKPLLGAFLLLGAGASAALFCAQRGDWLLALALFLIANVGASGSFVFYDALLPHVARPAELDRLSTSGYALGYLGGGIVLALNLAWISRPDLFGLPAGEGLSASEATLPTRLAFVSVGLWWILFSIPLFRRVKEPAGLGGPPPSSARALARETLRGLARTLRELLGFRPALLMLLAFLVYNDGIATIIRMAAIFGERAGVGRSDMILAIVMVQFLGIPFTLAFGAFAGKVGAKRAVLVAIAVYALIGLVALRMRGPFEFYLLAFLVSMVQGGAQALSRSLFASMIPRQKSAEFFSLFAVLDRFAGIAGPALFSALLVWTGSQRLAIAPLIGFFAIGALVLSRVDVELGRRQARAAEAEIESGATRGV